MGCSSLVFWFIGIFLGAMVGGNPPGSFATSPLLKGGTGQEPGLGVPDGGDLLEGGGIQTQVFVGDVLFHLFTAGGSDDGA